jgi:acyl-homoserine lactone acylase PvdQ
LETSTAMQADHLSLDVKDLQPFIAMIAPSDERARKAQTMLLAWNGVMDKDRAEPLIYTHLSDLCTRSCLTTQLSFRWGRKARSP